MDINKINANIATASAALTAVTDGIALAVTAYSILKGIWLRTNPGKTEDDYLNYLKSSSQLNIDDTATQLKADGWVETSPGNWTQPK